MIVTSDAGSVYEPGPSLTCSWDAGAAPPAADTIDGITQSLEGLSFKSGESSSSISVESVGERIYVYHGPQVRAPRLARDAPRADALASTRPHAPPLPQGTFTFTRFQIRIPLTSLTTTKVAYRVNGGTTLHFHVPGTAENLRWAAHSCNGFSGGVDTDAFFNKDKGFTSGYDPLWEDLLDKHEDKPFHCLVGGGDQIYCDRCACPPAPRLLPGWPLSEADKRPPPFSSLMFEPEMQEWANAGTAHAKINASLTPEVMFAIDRCVRPRSHPLLARCAFVSFARADTPPPSSSCRYYFSHYCKIFRSGAFGLANASIPMLNMLDDHDLIDGFGPSSRPHPSLVRRPTLTRLRTPSHARRLVPGRPPAGARFQAHRLARLLLVPPVPAVCRRRGRRHQLQRAPPGQGPHPRRRRAVDPQPGPLVRLGPPPPLLSTPRPRARDDETQG